MYHQKVGRRPLGSVDEMRRSNNTGYKPRTPLCLPVNDKRAAPQCRRDSPTTVIPQDCPRSTTTAADPTSGGSPRATADSNRKLKTEMCKNILSQGYCCWGSSCLFAHSEDERMKFSSVEEMYEYGLVNKADVGVYLSRVCAFWVRSGSCPYNTRCKSLHDPRLLTPTTTPSWLEHYTKFNKKDPTLILDRLHHCRMNAVIQKNPLVDPFVWNECRPDKKDQDNEDAKIWSDTYRLVCNTDVAIFSPREVVKEKGVLSYSNVVNRHVNKVTELQKLCIVAAMRKPSKLANGMGGHDACFDFTYEPTHCLNGQPCMILQLRFFRLLDYKQKYHVSSIQDVVEEISMQDCQRLSSNLTTKVYEVVMDSKGKRSANLSLFFDVDITSCSNNKAKRVSKKGEEHWQLESKTLFCMPKNDLFTSSLPSTKPYVMMQPVDDKKEGHALIDGIMEHRIGSLLNEEGCRFGMFTKESLHEREAELKSKLILMMDEMKRDFWPVTNNMDHIKKTTEERNQTEYHPSDVEGSNASKLWDSFVSNLNAIDDSPPPQSSTKRLSVFESITSKQDTNTNLPHIKYKRPTQTPSSEQPSNFNFSEATWKELLEGQTGSWAAARYTYDSKNAQMYKSS